MQDILDKIVNNIMDVYHYELRQYFMENKGKLLTNDVILLILNITSNVSTNLFYSLEEYSNDEKIDYDFVKVKMINELATTFEAIKIYQPNKEVNEISAEQVKEIFSKGSTMITLKDGRQRKITEQQLMLTKEDYEKYMEQKEMNH